jgi:hypothetical protein
LQIRSNKNSSPFKQVQEKTKSQVDMRWAIFASQACLKGLFLAIQVLIIESGFFRAENFERKDFFSAGVEY